MGIEGTKRAGNSGRKEYGGKKGIRIGINLGIRRVSKWGKTGIRHGRRKGIMMGNGVQKCITESEMGKYLF